MKEIVIKGMPRTASIYKKTTHIIIEHDNEPTQDFFKVFDGSHVTLRLSRTKDENK